MRESERERMRGSVYMYFTREKEGECVYVCHGAALNTCQKWPIDIIWQKRPTEIIWQKRPTEIIWQKRPADIIWQKRPTDILCASVKRGGVTREGVDVRRARCTLKQSDAPDCGTRRDALPRVDGSASWLQSRWTLML